MPFAEGTTVAVEKTRAEIEALLRKAGATEFTSGYTAGEAGFSFVLKGRRVSFSVARPSKDDPKIVKRAMTLSRRSYGAPAAPGLARAIEEEERRLWRCLLLAMKAKLEIVGSGIATFEEEFLAHIVTDTGQTIIERIRLAEQNGGPRLLGGVS
jgi:hypothetical protein